MKHRVIFYMPGTGLSTAGPMGTSIKDAMSLQLTDSEVESLKDAINNWEQRWHFGTLSINLAMCPLIDGLPS